MAFDQWSRPAVLVDLGCAAELAQGDHQRRIEQPALVQILDQRRDRDSNAAMRFLQRLEEVDMMVPSAFVEGDERHAGLDQPPGEQRPLAEPVPTVTIADLVGLVADVEGALGLGRGIRSYPCW